MKKIIIAILCIFAMIGAMTSVNSIKDKINKNNISTTYDDVSLKKLTLSSLGDSLTAGHGNKDNWVYYINQQEQFKYVSNYGIGGSTIAIVDEDNINSHTPLVSRYTQMPHSDIISVMCGVNDRDLNVPLGDENSTDLTTFYGALDLLVRGLVSRYNTSYIFFMTPLPTTWDTNKLGLNLDDYCNAIKNVCERYDVDVLDTHNEMKFDFDTDTTDGEHLTSKAYKEIMAPFIANYLKANYDKIK